jgi:hypothetical protein
MKKKLLTLSASLIAALVLAQTPRLSLYEEFTGETCPPCAATNPGLNAILSSPNNTPNIVAIKWQVPIPSAPSNTWSLYQTNKVEINWRYSTYGYGINSAPSGRIDGQSQTVFGAISDHPAYMSDGIIATAQSYTSAFSLTMDRAWDATCSSVNLTVNITASANFTATGALVFRTVMIERLIQFSVQPGTNGEKIFEDVAIKSFPSIQNGVAMASTWITGQSQTFTLNCPIPSYTRKKEEIAFVGFIQDDGNRQVAQAVLADRQALPNDAVAIAAKVPVTCNNVIFPEVVVMNKGLNSITDLTITPYADGVAGALTTWSGNLAANTSTSIPLNSINTSTASGSHTFSYNITAMNATDFNLTNNAAKVIFLVAGNYQSTPVVEGFDLGVYPPSGWTLINPNNGTSTWARNISAGGYGLTYESTKYDFFNNTLIGDQDELYLPPANLSGLNNPILSFDVAYAQRTITSDDKLEVLVSDDCGASWFNAYTSSGTTGLTLLSLPVTNAYLPADNDWNSVSLALPNFNKPNVLVKFVTTNDNGNNLYVDNINLSQPKPTSISAIINANEDVVLFPNPTNELVNLRINASSSFIANISLLNVLGQTVYTKQVSLNDGGNSIQLDVAELASGVYSFIIDSTSGSITKKLMINVN